MAASASGSAETIAGVASIIDGDTIEVQGTRVRDPRRRRGRTRSTVFEGKAPHRCGDDSRAALQRIIAGAAVTCTIRGRGSLRESHCDVRTLGRPRTWARAGSAGLGHCVHSQAYLQAYLAEEREARGVRRGLWAGEFQQPEEWRREHSR